MSKLRFRVTDAPASASLVSQLQRLTDLSISEIRHRVVKGLPVVEFTAFTATWGEDRAKLVDVANRIESGELPLAASEVYDDGAESPVSKLMLRNLISQFRDIELDVQRDTMLELGEIDDPQQFEPYDADWTR
ncbi:MAG: hypothetical protein ACO1RT_07425 [Planctomycetaceae bacterium]